MKNEPFWIVWNPDGRTPVVRHCERELAILEAERLARANAGQTFIVLVADTSRQVEHPMKCVDYEVELPF